MKKSRLNPENSYVEVERCHPRSKWLDVSFPDGTTKTARMKHFDKTLKARTQMRIIKVYPELIVERVEKAYEGKQLKIFRA